MQLYGEDARLSIENAEEGGVIATAVAPKLEHGHSSVGLVLMDQGRYQEAEQEMLTALQLEKRGGL